MLAKFSITSHPSRRPIRSRFFIRGMGSPPPVGINSPYIRFRDNFVNSKLKTFVLNNKDHGKKNGILVYLYTLGHS